MKFTNEQLSRILSAHEGGQLAIGDHDWTYYWIWSAQWSYVEKPKPPCGCAIEVAYVKEGEQLFGIACRRFDRVIDWFDGNYSKTWSVGTLLRALEEEGFA